MQLSDILVIPDKPLSMKDYRAWVDEIEKEVKSRADTYDRHSSITQGFRLEHAFTPGIYTREITMPAGYLVFSKIHTKEHPFVITKGRVSIYDGIKVVTVEAPFKGVTPAGTKRIVYPHTDTTWMTFHPTEKTSLEEVDVNGVITCETFEEFDKLEAL